MHPRTWLFHIKNDNGAHIDIQTAQRLFHAAKRRAGIVKQSGIHSFRHEFAVRNNNTRNQMTFLRVAASSNPVFERSSPNSRAARLTLHWAA